MGHVLEWDVKEGLCEGVAFSADKITISKFLILLDLPAPLDTPNHSFLLQLHSRLFISFSNPSISVPSLCSSLIRHCSGFRIQLSHLPNMLPSQRRPHP